jgi:hypothetical protein
LPDRPRQLSQRLEQLEEALRPDHILRPCSTTCFRHDQLPCGPDWTGGSHSVMFPP